MKRVLSRVVPAALAAIAAAGLSVAAAQPASAAVTWQFQGSGTSSCLDGFDGHREGDVYITGCNTGRFQKFRWVGSFGRQTQLVSDATGQCAWQEGLTAGLTTCNGSPSQVWVVSGSASRAIIKKNGTNYCLTRLGTTNVRLQTCDGNRYQDWVRRS